MHFSVSNALFNATLLRDEINVKLVYRIAATFALNR